MLATTTIAVADPVDAPDRQRAKTHYKQGKAFLDSGLYDDAIREFQAAYQIAPVPELLFNIAQAARLKGDAEKALAMYQKYIEEAPDGPGADESHTHIATLTKAIREHRTEPPPTPATKPTLKPFTDDDDDKPVVTPPPATPPTIPVPPPQPAPVVDDPEVLAHHRALGRYLIYGGAGLELVAGAFMYFGLDLNNQIRSKVFTTADDLRSAQTLGTVYNWTAVLAGTLGVAGIATGVTLIIRNQDVQVSAASSSSFTGLVLSGRM
jgi:tetratricopeptide (TPR) repeat protein